MNIQTINITNQARLKVYVPDGQIEYGVYRKKPGILLAPGGAYFVHATKEMEAMALEFLAKGYNVYILEYSLGFSSREAKESGLQELDTPNRYPLPVLEMMEAIHFVKTNADNLNLDPARLFLMGFSAGAHVCASCGVFWNSETFTDQLSFTPEGQELKVTGMILGYPLLNPSIEMEQVLGQSGEARPFKEFLFDTQTPSQEQLDAVNLILHVSPETVPAFIWHSVDDPIVIASDTTLFVYALQRNGVACEYHLFERGGHGIALATDIYAQEEWEIQPHIAIWTKLADEWMRDRSEGGC